MKVRGCFICNGAEYAFVSLHGDFKWVYGELLKYMKKWNVLFGRIFVDNYWKYNIVVNDTYIL